MTLQDIRMQRMQAEVEVRMIMKGHAMRKTRPALDGHPTGILWSVGLASAENTQHMDM
jgi:hypothetical protein